MGYIMNLAQALIQDYVEENIDWGKSLIDAGWGKVPVNLAAMKSEEVHTLMLKLDQMALSRNNESIAVMLTEEAESILLAARMLKYDARGPFTGILGISQNLDVTWLRPKDVGATALLNKDSTGSLGLYGGTSGGVLSWLRTFVAGTSQDIIPTQTMAQYAAVIHLGAIDTVPLPKVNAFTVTLSGVASARQSMPFNIRRGFGDKDMPFVRFEKPIIVGPLKQQKMSLMPNISGDSKLELLSLVFARSQDLTL